jgi:hypothetical protein
MPVVFIGLALFFIARLVAERIVDIDEWRHFTNAERERRMAGSIRATFQKTIADFGVSSQFVHDALPLNVTKREPVW